MPTEGGGVQEPGKCVLKGCNERVGWGSDIIDSQVASISSILPCIFDPIMVSNLLVILEN